MKNKPKLMQFKGKTLKHDFTGSQITKYAGLSPISQFNKKENLYDELNDLFPTIKYNSTKFSISQIITCIILASQSGINRLSRFSNFSYDPLVQSILGLPSGINKDAFSTRLKELGQPGALSLQEYLGSKTRNWISKTNLTEIILDCDSTVSTTCGKQAGAVKGFNTTKKGGNSYHPLLVFIPEMKIVANTWFRTGSAYTANGICDFVKQTHEFLPSTVKKALFRADSGFFNGDLFDTLEEFEDIKYDYLVKVKLYSNIKRILLEEAIWTKCSDNKNISYCEFEYKAKGWGKARTLKAVRTVKETVKQDFFTKKIKIVTYEYACFCSNLDLNGAELHIKYKERSTSETWIEQVKSQLLSGKTLTDNFHANDILWQLNVFSYNLSVMMRIKWKKFWKEEHATFRNWFIDVPALIIKSGRRLILKIYEKYYFKDRWKSFEKLLLQG